MNKKQDLVTYEEFQKALKTVNDYKQKVKEHYDYIKKEAEGVSKFVNVTKETILEESNVSTRLINILICGYEKWNIGKINRKSQIKELDGLSMSDFLKLRVAGKKSLEELKELCFYAGINLTK